MMIIHDVNEKTAERWSADQSIEPDALAIEFILVHAKDMVVTDLQEEEPFISRAVSGETGSGKPG